MFSETDFRILDSYKSVLDGLAKLTLGMDTRSYCIVLHDFDHSVIKIINGHYTGRFLRSFPISDLALSMLFEKIEERPDTNQLKPES